MIFGNIQNLKEFFFWKTEYSSASGMQRSII